MDAPSYVKAPLQRRFGLRERLMLGLLLGALGTIIVAVVGWLSFQRVVSSQQAIVRETLPTADALHDAVRGNARLAALAPRLTRADTLDELAQFRSALNTELPLIRSRLATLDSPHVEAELRARLRATGDALAAQLDTMADTIAARLHLRDARAAAARTLRDSPAGVDTHHLAAVRIDYLDAESNHRTRPPSGRRSRHPRTHARTGPGRPRTG